MKRLVVCCALLFAGFTGLVTGCGSRSSDDLYLPAVAAGNAPFGSGGSVGVAGEQSSAAEGGLASGGLSSAAGANTGGLSSSGAAGSLAASGSSGFLSVAGNSGTAGAGGFAQAGAAVSGSSGLTDGGAEAAGAAGVPTAGDGGVSGGGASGGAGGVAGVGGVAGAANVSCPAAAPQSDDPCSDTSLTCAYVGERCRCRAGGNETAWRCNGSGDACPSTLPVASSACTGDLQCPYPGGDQCNCQNQQWDCFSQGCPSTKPTPGASCAEARGQCTYDAAGACLCVAGSWFCN